MAEKRKLDTDETQPSPTKKARSDDDEEPTKEELEKYAILAEEQEKKEQEEEAELILNKPSKYAVAKIDFNRRTHETDRDWLIRNRRYIEIAFKSIDVDKREDFMF
jgi:hypothetical protein